MKIETFVRKQVYILFGLALGIVAAYVSTNYPSLLSTVPAPTPTIMPTVSATPSATPVARHGGEFVTVVSVVDGDTIKIEGGEVVRYIGINTPETVAPGKSVECFGKEASAKNKELVQGKVVELTRDVSQRDRYGRLLRYVWLGDTMINEILVREGYAQVSTYPPDVAKTDVLLEAQRQAREEEKGLWRICPPSTPTPKINITATPSAAITP
ncbi:thermonuclease family protein [Candidatus Gottesmanbacteria bacterium]|nr:thermonuclease family protein [Candidatus Gottesmanbacteria bacterium]